MKKILQIFVIVLLIFAVGKVQAQETWVNDARKLFLDNNAIIYEINIRNFNAKDNNGNGIIEFELGEESGSFINAIERLDELKKMGINMIHVLPITQTGKTKALGTAGSLYAASSFNKINEQLKDKTSSLELNEQVKKFVDKAHARGIRVIIDLPACGAYDLYLQRPELFVKDNDNSPVIPSDWTDVRLLNAGNEDIINTDVFGVYKEFVDLAIDDLGVDGIRADVAHCKPAKFWRTLIAYSREKDSQFLWLAESSDSWHDAVSVHGVFTPYDKLLQSGFDGYYGSFFNLKEWSTSQALMDHILFNLELKTKFYEPKSVIGSFATHDELSPILVKGIPYSSMIIWLNTTLPINAYYLDGFASGDDYIYPWANQKALITYTDDDYYFAHRGKIDIFNFSKKPQGDNQELLQEFIAANHFRVSISKMLSSGRFIPLKSDSTSVFAYALTDGEDTVLVYGNLDFENQVKSTIKVSGLAKDAVFIPIKAVLEPICSSGKISVELQAGEIVVLKIKNFTIK